MSGYVGNGAVGNFAVGGPGGGSNIKSIQTGTILLGSGVTTNTATIDPVDTDKSIVIFEGNIATYTSTSPTPLFCQIELTNSTTVTATRANDTSTATASYTVIEFTSLKSVQAVSIVITGNNVVTNTATISEVDTDKTWLIFNGYIPYPADPTTAFSNTLAYVELTNSTTVTATRGAGGSAKGTQINCIVVEFN